MCKNWIEIGVCRYGSKCQFAHGDHELIGKAAPLNAKYKSKTCTTFQEKLFCPYGKRCLFKHEDRTLEELKSFHYVLKLQFFPEQALNDCLRSNGEIKEEKGARRLKIFQEITSEI